jgi:peptidoglycan/xylan/chitin deacetylase (PgdA/CDA1 family)
VVYLDAVTGRPGLVASAAALLAGLLAAVAPARGQAAGGTRPAPAVHAAPVPAERPLPPVILSGPEGCHAVALTFDLCPVVKGPGWDAGLIDLLRERGVPATFFASGRWMAKHDDQLKTLLTTPFFEVETHGDRHRHLPRLDVAAQRAEITAPVTLLAKRYGRGATLVRAPFGEFDDRTRAVVADAGLRLVQWSVVSGDPDPRISAAGMLRALRANLRDGSIVIFHANGKGKRTREVVETLLETVLPERGLSPRTVAELLKGCHGGHAS